MARPCTATLFQELRGGKLRVVVRRQYIIGRYIADLAVPSRRLVIEVDGPYHAARRTADARRDCELSAADGAFCGCPRSWWRRKWEAVRRVREALA